ncbi:MAG TPA: molybdopterin-dependent oxidoreductase [Bryobacteraceae bacterium]
MDRPVIPDTPRFVKSLPVDVALNEHTLVALEMNGKPLPHWNGYPARLVVPGWTATYWVKHLQSITISSIAETNFWMSKAYRLPRGKFPPSRFESQITDTTEPITTLVVNSLITSLTNGRQIPYGSSLDVRGIAWDSGSGIDRVEVSIDSGATWQRAALGRELGRFSFREFRFTGRILDGARLDRRHGACDEPFRRDTGRAPDPQSIGLSP